MAAKARQKNGTEEEPEMEDWDKELREAREGLLNSTYGPWAKDLHDWLLGKSPKEQDPSETIEIDEEQDLLE